MRVVEKEITRLYEHRSDSNGSLWIHSRWEDTVGQEHDVVPFFSIVTRLTDMNCRTCEQ